MALLIEESLPSTQTLAAERARAGAPDGFAVLARRQTAGRGRAGRLWNSPPGNLHLSLVLRPGGPIAAAPAWALRAAVALAEALAPHAPELTLKWPNDVMLGGAKLAGILAEAEDDGQGGIAHIILGFGANLAHAPDVPDRPTACLPPPAPMPEVVAQDLLTAIARIRALPFAAVLTAWCLRGPREGEAIALRDGRAGTFAGLAEDGRLLLRQGQATLAISAGEVT